MVNNNMNREAENTGSEFRFSKFTFSCTYSALALITRSPNNKLPVNLSLVSSNAEVKNKQTYYRLTFGFGFRINYPTNSKRKSRNLSETNVEK